MMRPWADRAWLLRVPQQELRGDELTVPSTIGILLEEAEAAAIWHVVRGLDGAARLVRWPTSPGLPARVWALAEPPVAQVGKVLRVRSESGFEIVLGVMTSITLEAIPQTSD